MLGIISIMALFAIAFQEAWLYKNTDLGPAGNNLVDLASIFTNLVAGEKNDG